MSNDSRIQALTEEFAAKLTAVVRESALQAMRQAFEGQTGSAPARRRGRPPGRKSKASAAAPKVTRKKKGGRRSSGDVDAEAGQILAFVKSNPGVGAIEISSQLGVATKDVALPIKKLLAERQLRTEGQRRGTKYFAGGGGPKVGRTSKRGGRRRKKGGRKTKAASAA